MASSAKKTGNIGVPFATSVTTNATTGQATVTFPAGLFTSAPIVSASAINTSSPSDGRDIVVTIIGAPTATGCTVMARKSQVLLALGDPFKAVAAPVHVMARASS